MGLCKSCYTILRRDPNATLRGTPECQARAVAGQARIEHRREASPKWRGGRFFDQDGYVRILPPPGYLGRKIHGGRYVHEHRYVMEQTLGRLLTRSEVVHHINHVRNDNRPENLRLFASLSEHRLHHARVQRVVSAQMSASEWLAIEAKASVSAAP